MNLLLNTETELKIAFDAIEGVGFFEQSMNPPGSHEHRADYALAGAYRHLERQMEPDAYVPEDDFVTFVIYGGGGWNRYYVFPTGEVQISKGHVEAFSSGEKAELLAKYKAIGFEIFD